MVVCSWTCALDLLASLVSMVAERSIGPRQLQGVPCGLMACGDVSRTLNGSPPACAYMLYAQLICVIAPVCTRRSRKAENIHVPSRVGCNQIMSGGILVRARHALGSYASYGQSILLLPYARGLPVRRGRRRSWSDNAVMSLHEVLAHHRRVPFYWVWPFFVV